MRTVKILFIILIFVFPFILHVWKKNMVNALNIKISSLTTEVQNLERSVMLLSAKWRNEASFNVVEKKAKEILEMRYPARDEIFEIQDFDFLR